MKPLHIFKPGKHTAMSGASFDFSESDLAATVRAYDPALHEAPMVIGHPKHDGPASGWIQSLTATPEGLIAVPAQVDADFAEQVAKGSYKKISASFYHPDAANNPVPGVYYLRHVGFLGAQPPSVKGLRPIELADGEQGVVEFGDYGKSTFGASESTDAVFQARNMSFQLTLVFRQLHGTSGAISYLDRIRECLTGWKPPHCDLTCRPTAENFIGQVQGLWQYGLSIATRAVQLQIMGLEEGPLLTELPFEVYP
ncbi:hypothetical protein G9Q86_15050 [Pseudomonas sp. CCUG 57209]|uniref:Gp37 family protein n=1 Tax=Pseudomonas sivasensis TaxID=1880678 RepID=UPI001F5C04C2|nr:Gp37 family protein [Pseudomonas sivasensis]MBA2929890.1 hypothetical protein [Pseudomonas sivasensis]